MLGAETGRHCQRDNAVLVRLLVALALALVSGCAAEAPTPNYPAFEGRDTDVWLAYQLDVPGRRPDDLLPAFEASAKAFGCRTDHLGASASPNIMGETREWYGIAASCDEGTISLITLAGDRVRIGCARPTTREKCDALLQRISEAR